MSPKSASWVENRVEELAGDRMLMIGDEPAKQPRVHLIMFWAIISNLFGSSLFPANQEQRQATAKLASIRALLLIHTSKWRKVDPRPPKMAKADHVVLLQQKLMQRTVEKLA